MGRKCSHCGNIGHNSRTCTNFRGTGTSFGVGHVGFRLFGVQLHHHDHHHLMMPSSSNMNHHVAMSMKKSFSMDCLPTSSASSSSPSSSRISVDENSIQDKASIGYLSDGLICRAQERKKGVPWTEEEHRTFLIGLEKLGKGDWRGISRNYVTTRTPTQVASHAQKYFLRQATLTKKKRRSSLFDMFGRSNNINLSTGHPANTNTSHYKQPLSDDHQVLPRQHNNIIHDNSGATLPLLELGTSVAAQNPNLDNRKPDHCRANQQLPVWIYGLIDSQMKYSSNIAASKPASSVSVVPDLELKLAAPTSPSLEQKNKSSPSPAGPLLNLGPISVT
ncbi:unnamed protein product [Prunus brigantina]